MRRHAIVALAGGLGAALAGLASCAVRAEGLAMVGAALAQSADPLGTSTPSIAERLVTGTISAVALGVALYGFVRLATGRHTAEGIVMMGVGALGIATAGALAVLLLRGLSVVFG